MNKTKWIVAISSLCLSITMLVIGVLALTSVPLVVGGNVNFTADGVIADISKGTLSGGSNSGSSMNAVSINVNNNWSTVESNLNTWKSLNLSFADGSEKITLSFTVTNKHTSDYLEINTSIDSGTSNNIVISTSSANTVLYPNTTANNSAQTDRYTFNIDFSLINPEYNGSISGFTINLYLTTYEIPDESNYSGILTFGSKVAGTSGGIGTASVKGATNTITQAKIPFLFKNGSSIYKVTSIETRGFRYFESLSSITIPNSVTSIGNYAFEGCIALTNVVIPNSVTSTGSSVFYECSSLQSATLPNSLTQISSGIFQKTALNNVIIPNTITDIESYAFDQCGSLTSIIIPDSVQSIADNAFSSCNDLTSVILGNGLTEIWDNAFLSTNISSITIPSSVNKIYKNAFGSCDNLTVAVFETTSGWRANNQDINASDLSNYIKAAEILKNSYDKVRSN